MSSLRILPREKSIEVSCRESLEFGLVFRLILVQFDNSSGGGKIPKHYLRIKGLLAVTLGGTLSKTRCKSLVSRLFRGQPPNKPSSLV